jgi:hypothetical protein
MAGKELVLVGQKVKVGMEPQPKQFEFQII